MVSGYKKTEIGVVPSEWDVLSFGEVFRTLSNNTLSRDQLNYDSGSIKDIHYDDVLILFPEVLDCSRDDIPYVNSNSSVSGQPLQDGDVIISDTAEDETVGKAVEIANQENTNIVAGLHTIPCRVKNSKFASGWLGYFINSHYYHDQLLPYIHGTKVSSIARESLADTYIAVPPYGEQEKIVNALTDIGGLISESEKLIEKYQAMKQGCLQHMFPHKGQTEPDMRLPGFAGAWEQRKLGDLIIKGGSGGTPSATRSEYYGGDIPFLTISDIKNRDIITTEKTLTKDGLINSTAWVAPAGAVSLAMYASVGKVGILSMDSATSQAFFNMCFDDNTLRNFVYYRLVKADSEHEWEPLISTGTQRNLNAEKVKQFEVSIPQIEEMKEISDFLWKIDNLITLHQRKCEKYKMIKQGMMEDLLTGKVRLK